MSRIPPSVPSRPGTQPTLGGHRLRPMTSIPTMIEWKAHSENLRQGPTPALVKLILALDDLIAKYNQAFSPMAKRNMAKAVADGATAWITKAKQTSPIMTIPQALTDLHNLAIRAGGNAVRTGLYTKIACVGWAVKTGAWDTTTFVQKWDEQNQKWVKTQLVQYTGYPDEDMDLTARIVAMKQAMGKAASAYNAQHGHLPDDRRTLKVFMAPEFFFRGKSGAYSIDKVASILPRLREESANSIYSSWLFVFGTAIGATINTETYCTRCGNPLNKLVRTGPGKFSCPSPGCGTAFVRELAVGATIDNVALIQKGGDGGDDNAYTVAKEFVSHIDFRRVAKTHPNGAKILDNNWNKDRRIELDTGSGMQPTTVRPTEGSRDVNSAAQSRHTDERMGGGIFTISGISFGMEICLDHYKNRLATQRVQVQLVPSAGASLQRFGCVDGGIAFNVDGLGPKADARVNDGRPVAGAFAPPAIAVPFAPGGPANVPAGQIVVYAPVDVAPMV
jgi:hypothetical protein